MPSRGLPDLFGDILECIDYVAVFTDGMNFEQYCSDRLTSAAVERMLQIISEAAIRIGPHAEVICPGPDWPNVRGLGNILRHVYDQVDDEIVWGTIQEFLPSMRDDVVKAIARL